MKNHFEAPSPINPEEGPSKLKAWTAFIASPEQPPTEQEQVSIFDKEMGAAFTHIVRTPVEKREEVTRGLNHFFKERLGEIKSPISLLMDESEVKESLARTLALAGDMLRRVAHEAEQLEKPAAHVALTVLRPDAANGHWSLIGATAGITKVYVYRKATSEIQQLNIEDNRAGARSPIFTGNLYNTQVAREEQRKFKHVKTAADVHSLTPQDEYLFAHRNEPAGWQLVGERVSQSDMDLRRAVVPAKTFAATHLQEGDYVLLGGATLDAVDQATLKKLLLKALASNNQGATLAEAIATAASDSANIRKTPGPVALGVIAIPAALPPAKTDTDTINPARVAKLLEGDPFEDDAPTREVGVFEAATSYADLYTILKKMPADFIFEEDKAGWSPAAILASLRCVEEGIMKLREVTLPKSIVQKVKSFEGKKRKEKK